MWWDWFWYAFVTLWAFLVGLKLYQMCKRRKMVEQARRQQQTQITVANVNRGYYGLSDRFKIVN